MLTFKVFFPNKSSVPYLRVFFPNFNAYVLSHTVFFPKLKFDFTLKVYLYFFVPNINTNVKFCSKFISFVPCLGVYLYLVDLKSMHQSISQSVLYLTLLLMGQFLPLYLIKVGGVGPIHPRFTFVTIERDFFGIFFAW